VQRPLLDGRGGRPAGWSTLRAVPLLPRNSQPVQAMPHAQVDSTSPSAILPPTCTADACAADPAVVSAPSPTSAHAAEPTGASLFDFAPADVCGFDDLVALLGKPRSTVYRWLQQRALVLDRAHMRVLGAASSLDAAPAGAALVVPEWGGVREAGAPHWTFRVSYVDAYLTRGFAHVMAALEAFHRALRPIGDTAGPKRR